MEVSTMARTYDGRGSTNTWSVGTREVVFMAIGAALYGVLGWATAIARLPGPFNVSARPAVAILMLFGGVFGPWVGFFTGLVGNIIIDLLSGYGFSWNWSLANGLAGLIAGIAFARARRGELPSLGAILTWSIIGVLIAFLLSSISDIWVYGTEPGLVPLQYIQVVGPNILFGVILVPLLYVAYRQVTERSGR
jgi:energy-coupling factor transport system substrate-specific component